MDRLALSLAAEPDATCELLSWDSEFWGFPIGRVVGRLTSLAAISAVDSWSDQRGVRCVYWLAADATAGDVAQAEAAGFRCVDHRVTLGDGLQVSDASSPASGCVRRSRPEDVPALEAIARSAHHQTRFYSDGRFPRARCDDLYALWIRRSVEGYADAVFVAEDAGRPVGYITCHGGNQQRVGSIGLVAVSSTARGKGVGSALVSTALAWFGHVGSTHVEVVTQAANTAAIALYERFGFRTKHVQPWLHKWYEPSTTR